MEPPAVEAKVQIELEALKKRLFTDNKVKNVKFFPGSNADVSPEDIAREINKFFADPDADGTGPIHD